MQSKWIEYFFTFHNTRFFHLRFHHVFYRTNRFSNLNSFKDRNRHVMQVTLPLFIFYRKPFLLLNYNDGKERDSFLFLCPNFRDLVGLMIRELNWHFFSIHILLNGFLPLSSRNVSTSISIRYNNMLLPRSCTTIFPLSLALLSKLLSPLSFCFLPEILIAYLIQFFSRFTLSGKTEMELLVEWWWQDILAKLNAICSRISLYLVKVRSNLSRICTEDYEENPNAHLCLHYLMLCLVWNNLIKYFIRIGGKAMKWWFSHLDQVDQKNFLIAHPTKCIPT